jgi:hypothetical protein
MGKFINIGGIDTALCDKSLLDYFLNLSDDLSPIFFEVNNGIDILYNNLIQTNKYQEIRSKMVDSQFSYLEELKNQKSYYHPPQSEFSIFDYSLAENILELMSSYHIMLTHEGMCNLMNYIFYDVYCTKKSLPPHYSFAKPTVDDEYEDRKFYNPDYRPSKWNWDKNIVFEGINEYVHYEVNARKFWKNFAQELLQKLGSIYFHLITHDYNEKHIIDSYNDNFFIVQTHSFTFAEEPWYELDAFPRILKSHDENAKDLSGKFFTNILNSSNPLPDFYKSATEGWKPDCGTNLYSPIQRTAYGVFQKLKELGISTNTILSGTVRKVQNPNW